MSQAAHGAGTPNRQARTHGGENYILTRVFAHDFDARPMIQWGTPDRVAPQQGAQIQGLLPLAYCHVYDIML